MAVNYGRYKNRLGAYHAPMHTFLDFGFLRTLPISQGRNGFAELIKISSCAHLMVFELLDKFCEQLIDTQFGRKEGAPSDVRNAADIVCHSRVPPMTFTVTELNSGQSRRHLRDAKARVSQPPRDWARQSYCLRSHVSPHCEAHTSLAFI